MKLRIITNFSRLPKTSISDFQIDCHVYSSRDIGLVGSLFLFFRSFRYNYILVNGLGREVLFLAILKWMFPFHRTRIVLVDILLSAPRTYRDKAKALLLSVLLKKVYRILLYYKNTAGLQNEYGIPKEKFGYVPFKINEEKLVYGAPIKDEGYVFCGGKTRRDYDTLFKAVDGLDIPVKVVTTENSDILQHGSFLADEAAPKNVEIVRLDGRPEKFIAYMAASRLVVLPIKPDICGAGIGVYIMAMALKKCVILSAGPGSEDVLDPDMAIVVPARNPEAMRHAIDKAYRDSSYRKTFEERGHQYAISLKGEEGLLLSIAKHLHQDAVDTM